MKALFNTFIFVFGAVYLREGIKQERLGLVNAGMLIISALLFMRFLDREISFLIKGIVFLLIGNSLSWSKYISVQKKTSSCIKKTALYIVFGLIMLIYTGFPLSMIYSYEQVLLEGEVFKFRPRPVDPYHPFQGRYVTLRFDNDKMTYSGAREIFQDGEQAYLILTKDLDGFAIPEEILPDPHKKQTLH